MADDHSAGNLSGSECVRFWCVLLKEEHVVCTLGFRCGITVIWCAKSVASVKQFNLNLVRLTQFNQLGQSFAWSACASLLVAGQVVCIAHCTGCICEKVCVSFVLGQFVCACACAGNGLKIRFAFYGSGSFGVKMFFVFSFSIAREATKRFARQPATLASWA